MFQLCFIPIFLLYDEVQRRFDLLQAASKRVLRTAVMGVQIWQQTFLRSRILRQHSRYPGERSEEVPIKIRETGPDDG